ncbi:CHAT domain-containing protein [Streptomyces sp. NPDC101165]|uniref:CHAT domain-containing protein n=1 Tax=Streptomyces sp. NPDC101165 TaxID=3366119 RepID=UPI0038236ACB
MSDAGDVPAADRAVAALGRTAGISVPLDPDEYAGTRGPELDGLVNELELLLAELTQAQGCEATAAVVEARLGRCLAVRFVLEGAPADRERAVRLLDRARTSALLGHEDRESTRRDLVCLLGSRLVRLNRETSPGSESQWTIDQLTSMLAVGTPLAQGGSGMVEDTGLLVRLLLEREQAGMTPEDRDNLRGLGALTDALLKGDTDAVMSGARHLLTTMPGMALPPPLRVLMPSMFSMLEDVLGAFPDAVPTGAAPADDPDEAREVQHVRTQLLALTEVMSPGTIAPHELPRLLAELSGERDPATGEDGSAPLPSRMIAALFHAALAARTGDLEGFREAFRLMHEAHAKGELDSRVHAEWLRTVVPGLLLAAALTGGSLQDEDMARALLEAQQWDDDPASRTAASLRLCGETVRLNEKLMSALDSGDDAAVEDVIDALCEVELDESYDGAEEWTGALLCFVLGSAYLGRVVLAPSADDRTDHLRAAAHHLRRAVETSVDMPALRGVLDSTWAPLITLTAIAESDPSRIADGVRRTRKALESPGFTPDWRPRSRSGIAVALDTLHILTGDPEPLDEAIAELEQALTELPDGTPSGARLTWDQAVLRAKRATLRTGTPDADAELRAAVGLARTSLRLAADDVLLQQGVRRGLRIARAAADRGRGAAFWALRVGLTEEAIACLEAGRSLVLGAAAVSAGVADRLAALGETELAERWRSAAAADRSWDRTDDRSLLELSAAAGTGTGLPGDLRDRSPLEVLAEAGAGAPDLPGDLRRRSLDVLRGQGDADVQPVVASVSDLRAGLGETGADALLYLVPGVDGPDGAVLVVTRDGPVEALPLPGLALAGRGPVAEYLEAGAHRQRLEAAALDSPDTVNPRDTGRAERRWLGALDRMCEWAGDVLGPALDHLGVWDRALGESGFLGASAAAVGSEAVRLVLVPCGELGVVPWQAALLRPSASYDAPRAVRACEVAVLTHAASGREFLRAAARRRMNPADRPALVFHGTDDLEWAEDEIETLAEVHYPRAVIHRPDDDPATPETVLALLGGRAAVPASLVHIACHGLAGPDPTRSALQLAAPAGAASGGALTLSTLLETPAEGDAFRSAGPLVVCGGCETDLTTRDHDEALTVTSVMVHRLAADAVGSRWKVDDMRSEVLMLVLHNALARGLAPPDALRAAQRWMLTPPDERPPVRGLKGISARRLAEDFRDRPDTWAAFVHHGNPAPAARSARPQEGERV